MADVRHRIAAVTGAPTPSGTARGWQPLIRILLAVTLALMALVAFWPTPVDSGSRDGIWAFLHWARAWGLPAYITYAVVEFVANIAFFVPVGLLIALSVRPTAGGSALPSAPVYPPRSNWPRLCSCRTGSLRSTT